MAPRLRIYWVNQFSVTPDQSGGTRHYDMARELRQLCDEVVLVASDLSLGTRDYSRHRSSRDLRAIEEWVDGVEFIWLPAGSYLRNDWKRILSMLIFALSALSYLALQAEREKTVFIGSSPHLFAAAGTWVAARLRRVPFVFEVRDLWPESYEAVSGRTGGTLVLLLRLMADFLYRHADAVVVLTEPNREAVVRRGANRSRVHCVPNGVDLASVPERRRARSGRGPEVVFAYTGAHGPANGLDIVVDACAELHTRGYDDLRVVLVGDGPVKQALQHQAAEKQVLNLEFRDPIPKETIPSFFATVDVGLMVLAAAPLFATGVSPNKLFDYLASNLPVLTNVQGVVSEIVLAAGAGQTCAPGDPIALAEAMIRIANDIRLNANAYSGGRQFVAEHHNRRHLAHRLHGIARELTAAGLD